MSAPALSAPNTVYVPLVTEGLMHYYPQFFDGMNLAQAHEQVLATAANIWEQSRTPGTRLHQRLHSFSNGEPWSLQLHVFDRAQGWPKHNYDHFQFQAFPQGRDGEPDRDFEKRAALEVAAHEHRQDSGAGFLSMASVETLSGPAEQATKLVFSMAEVGLEVERQFEADLTRRLLPQLWPQYQAQKLAAQRESDNFMGQMRAATPGRSAGRAPAAPPRKRFLDSVLGKVGF